MCRVIIKDVVEKVKVLLKMVLWVINNEFLVMQVICVWVLCVIVEFDYEFDLFVCNLCSGIIFVIGLVYDNLNLYYIIGVQNGVLVVCCEIGFGLQIYFCDLSLLLLVDELVDWVQCLCLVGLVLIVLMFECCDLIQVLIVCGIKLVCIIVVIEDLVDGVCVFVDDCEVVYEIIEYLIQLGYQCIGFFWGGSLYCFLGECYVGYEVVLKDYGMIVDKYLVVQGDYIFDDGFCGVCCLLVLCELFIVIFGFNDEIVVGVLVVVKLVGMNVLYDLFIVGFEDSLFLCQLWLLLIIVKQVIEDIVCYVVCLLIV